MMKMFVVMYDGPEQGIGMEQRPQEFV